MSPSCGAPILGIGGADGVLVEPVDWLLPVPATTPPPPSIGALLSLV